MQLFYLRKINQFVTACIYLYSFNIYDIFKKIHDIYGDFKTRNGNNWWWSDVKNMNFKNDGLELRFMKQSEFYMPAFSFGSVKQARITNNNARDNDKYPRNIDLGRATP